MWDFPCGERLLLRGALLFGSAELFFGFWFFGGWELDRKVNPNSNWQDESNQINPSNNQDRGTVFADALGQPRRVRGLPYPSKGFIGGTPSRRPGGGPDRRAAGVMLRAVLRDADRAVWSRALGEGEGGWRAEDVKKGGDDNPHNCLTPYIKTFPDPYLYSP